MKIVCDACSAKYSIADEKVRGKVFKIRCKKCSNIIVVRGATPDAAPADPGFEDQKETRVFDYGYEDGGAGGGDEPVWHVVIDQEQVGPLSVQDVRVRYAAGDIDADTYIWREGFSDWLPLVEVDVFADIGAQASAAAPAPAAAAPAAAVASPVDDAIGGMFGGPSIEDSGTARSDPADLFASAGGDVDQDDDGGVGDLFGGSLGQSSGPSAASDVAAAAAPSGGGMADSLFGGASDLDDGGMGGVDEEGEPSLTGQRNENSVLFSLNNLAALAGGDGGASPSAAPSAAASASSAASPMMGGGGGGGSGAGVTGAAQGEGSGLIDIRAMAGAYLGDKSSSAAAPAGTGSMDDIPTFSSPAFQSGGGAMLLAAAPASGPDKKVLYGLVGVIGVLLVAAVVLVMVVMKGGKDDKPKVAANAAGNGDITKPGKTGDATDPENGTNGKTPSTDPGTTTDKPGTTTDKPGTTTDKPGTTTDKPKPATTKKPGTTKKPKPRTTSRSNRTSSRTSTRTRKPKPVVKPKPTRSGGCHLDEMGCMLAAKPPRCCSKYGIKGKRSTSSSKPKPASNSNLPDSLSRGDIRSGLSGIRGKSKRCGDRHSGKGLVKIRLKIGGNGRVSSASVLSAPNGALGGCVSRAAKRARFKKTKSGRTFTYVEPFR